MSRYFLYSIKDLSKDEKLSIAYFVYNLFLNDYSYEKNSAAQLIYNSLVSSLELKNHSKKVVDAILTMLIKEKFLTIKKYIDNNETIFKEDNEISIEGKSWKCENSEDLNLRRAIFSGKKEVFSKIVALTFFYEPNENKKTFTIPKEIELSSKLFQTASNTSSVDFFIKSFNLSKEEGVFLNIVYMSHAVKELYNLCSEILTFFDDSRIPIYSKLLGYSIRNIKLMLGKDRKLVTYGIMDKDGAITEDTIESIYAKDLKVFFSELFKSDINTEYYKLDSFPVKTNITELTLRLLSNDNSANILLYGSPGSGKTEFARSLVKNLGLNPLIFKNDQELDEKDNSSIVFGRLNCMLSLQKKDSVIIIDEAESLLSTSYNFIDFFFNNGASNKKGTINKILENNVNKVIWIVNYTSPIDESTLRRFTYSIHFNELSKITMQKIADTKLRKIKMSKKLHGQLVELCGKYRVTGASVENMIKTISGMDLAKKNEGNVINDVKQVLESNSTLLYGKSKIRGEVSDSYDLSVLNTSTSSEEIVNMILNAQNFAEKNALENNDTENNGIRILFYGLSGTGKTELARYIAERLNKKILLKRASDILSKYVGENETNIREAFEKAESSGDVLLFDEADSFFADRTSANHSWERTTVNEFLTQMEEFNGILICTTNLRQIMDPAMQRRFHILLEFKPLEKEEIKKLTEKYFHDYQFSSSHIERLNQYGSVTPGDFSTLASKIRFMNASNINSDLIYSELCKI